MRSRSYRVRGRVQGVGFRFFTRGAAKDLGLTGWVRNVPDGTVEAVAVGREENLDALGDLLKRGPRGSKVDGLEIKPHDVEAEFDQFEIRY